MSLLINIPRLSQVKSPKEISDNVICDKFILVYFEWTPEAFFCFSHNQTNIQKKYMYIHKQNKFLITCFYAYKFTWSILLLKKQRFFSYLHSVYFREGIKNSTLIYFYNLTLFLSLLYSLLCKEIFTFRFLLFWYIYYCYSFLS